MRLGALVIVTFFIAGCCCLDRSWSERPIAGEPVGFGGVRSSSRPEVLLRDQVQTHLLHPPIVAVD